MKILVTGGAGYIGSFMTKRLVDDGHEVVVTDSLERGYKKTFDQGTFIKGDLRDIFFTKNLFSQHTFDAVIHFAAYISMGESMENPGIYFNNNVFSALNILETMKENNVSSIIFSSTAGVYGNPSEIPIPESHSKNPTNPYGESKYIVERILPWYQKIHHINFASLRYFNASGGALDGSMGEHHDPETHIIPLAIRAVQLGTPFMLYGTDYDTKDGTCIRDYIHVLDLVEAHILALTKLEEVHGGYEYNVGTGHGYSNREVVAMIEEVSGKKIAIKEMERRSGDASVLIADSQKIMNELHFKPKHSDLQTIIKSAWIWHTKSN